MADAPARFSPLRVWQAVAALCAPLPDRATARLAQSGRATDTVRRVTAEPSGDWGFARRPFWLFSHLFAASVVLSFVALGFWQLSRLDQRQEANALVEARTATVQTLTEAPPIDADPADLDYGAVEAAIRITEPDFARVANRTQNGVAGEHVVAIGEFGDGSLIALNRGFVALGDDGALDQLPAQAVTVTGWLRATVERGSFGAVDQGEGDLLPRFDTERLGVRLGRPLPPVWLQVDTIDGVVAGTAARPNPVPLPPLDEGPHLAYAAQWFTFALLGIGFYGLLLRRRAKGHDSTVTVVETDDRQPDRVPG